MKIITRSRTFTLLLQTDNHSWEWRCLGRESRHTAGRLTRCSQHLNCCSVTTRRSSTRGNTGVPAQAGHTGTTSSSPVWKAKPGSTTVSVSTALPQSPHPASRSTFCSRAETLHRARPAHSVKGFCIQLMNPHVLEYNWYKKCTYFTVKWLNTVGYVW